MRNLEYIEEIQDLTYEMMDSFRSGLFWLIEYCEKNNLPLPDLDRAQMLILTSGKLLETEYNYQPRGNKENYQPSSKQNLENKTLYS